MGDLAANDPRHGTINGYNNLGCRCDRCREARRVYPPQLRAQRQWQARQAAKALAFDGHGSQATFDAGCRCGSCRGAEYRRRQRSAS